MIRTLLKLAIVALVANAAWHLFGAYSPNYRFQDSVQYVAQNRGQMSDEALKDKIVELAGQFDVPVTANDVSVSQQGTHTLVDVSYVRRIELAPSFTYPWNFSVHADVISLSSLK
jgi:hypothetical protein